MDFCEYDNIHSGSMKGGYFPGQLSDYQLRKKDSAIWT
jgi:hypothetical protein